jgi:hypothetical protein
MSLFDKMMSKTRSKSSYEAVAKATAALDKLTDNSPEKVQEDIAKTLNLIKVLLTPEGRLNTRPLPQRHRKLPAHPFSNGVQPFLTQVPTLSDPKSRSNSPKFYNGQLRNLWLPPPCAGRQTDLCLLNTRSHAHPDFLQVLGLT